MNSSAGIAYAALVVLFGPFVLVCQGENSFQRVSVPCSCRLPESGFDVCQARACAGRR